MVKINALCTTFFNTHQGRYTWRRDSVLQDLDVALTKLVKTFNSQTPKSFAEVAREDYKSSFVRAGAGEKLLAPKPSLGLLDFANDWKIQTDLEDHKSVSLCPTSLSWLCNLDCKLASVTCAEEGGRSN